MFEGWMLFVAASWDYPELAPKLSVYYINNEQGYSLDGNGNSEYFDSSTGVYECHKAF